MIHAPARVPHGQIIDGLGRCY